MTNGVLIEPNIQEIVQEIVSRRGATREELIPILTDIQRELGYVPSEAITEVSKLLQVPKSRLYGVVSFYSMLSTKPRGRHVIQFCESAPCHVVGGREVWEALQAELGLHPGETSQDGKWTLLTTSCLGVCGVGPVFTIGEDMYGNVTPAMLPEILGKYE
jgi:NADH-quinone oxidoreductase subunit E